MLVDTAIQFNQYMNSLEEPKRAIIVIALSIGIPLLLVFLYWLDEHLAERS